MHVWLSWHGLCMCGAEGVRVQWIEWSLVDSQRQPASHDSLAAKGTSGYNYVPIGTATSEHLRLALDITPTV